MIHLGVRFQDRYRLFQFLSVNLETDQEIPVIL